VKIVLDATIMEAPKCGIVTSTIGLYRAALQLEPSMEVICIHRRSLQNQLPAGVKPDRMSSVLGRGIVRKYFHGDMSWREWAFKTALQKHLPTAVHFPHNGDVCRQWQGTPIITTLHDVLPLDIPGYFEHVAQSPEEKYRERTQRDLDLSDLVFTVSDYSRRRIAAHFRLRSEPVVMPWASPLSPLSATEPPPPAPQHPFFLYVGGYDFRKGLEPLLRVFGVLHRQGAVVSKLHLTGARNYYSNRFREMVTEGVAAGYVEELGCVSDQDLRALYRTAKALVYPSRYEGFGLPPLEAMSLGCPVIAVRDTAIPEVCGDAVLYVNPDDERDFGAGLLALEKNAALCAELRSRGFQQARQFTWEKTAKKFLSAVRALVKGK